MKFFYFYQLIYGGAVVLLLPFLTLLIYLKQDFRKSLHQRLGLYTRGEKQKLKSKRGCIWIHASSVGEIKLVSKISGFKNRKAIITTSTPAGKEVAKKNFSSAAVFLMPLDLSFMWKRFLKLARPRKLFVAETELWPGLIFSANIPKALFNGRMSDERYKIYLKLGKLMKIVLDEFDAIFARDRKNYERFLKTGAGKENLHMLGNLKFLQKKPLIDRSDSRYGKTKYQVIAAGCTHRGEEKIIIETVEKLRGYFPDIVLVVSPRHIKRVPEVEKEFNRRGLKPISWSRKKGSLQPSENIIVDSMGELAGIYSIADIVFVGGSFEGTGGHNVIEPAVWGKPVVVGPFYRNFNQEVRCFKSRGGLKVAMNRSNLYNTLRKWLKDPGERERAGAGNRAAAEEKRKQAEVSVRRINDFAASGVRF